MKRFFRGKVSLRLHIILAFLTVLCIAFTLILAIFNVMSKSYIENVAREAINNTFESIKTIAAKDSIRYFIDPRSPQDKIFDEIILPSIQTNPDRAISLVLTDRDSLLLWPNESYFDKGLSSQRDLEKAAHLIEHLQYNADKAMVQETTIQKIPTDSVYYSVYRISNSNNTILFNLYITYDVHNYMDFFDSINRILLTITVGTMILAVLMALFVSGGIISSIHSLEHFAEEIGSGNFKQKQFSFVDKEIDRLAVNMNIMAGRLERASHEQQVFFQNVSHELRTPLMSIQGYAEGLKYGVFEEPTAASEIIISESERLTGMVENLLTISRMDMASTGRQTITKSLFDLRELVGSVTEKIRGLALPNNIEILLSFPDEEITVHANENDLFRAIENILSNGIRYAKKEICVTISTQEPDADSENPGYACIQISDDGTGISETLMPNLFHRFAKGDGGKHGIGLALVKAIVTENGGTVTGGNNPDRPGAIFILTLPLATGA